MTSTAEPEQLRVKANSPFNKDSADAILRTADGVDFYVHTQLLCLVRGHVLDSAAARHAPG